MKQPLDPNIRELSWPRELTEPGAAQLRAWLAAHPEAQVDWEDEAALNRVLDQMPDVPVSSNFTALVVQAVQRQSEGTSPALEPRWWTWLRHGHWLPKSAIAALVLGAGVFAHHRHTALQHARLVEDLVVVMDSGVPGPEILGDFDAIQRLILTPPPDEDLLALMQ